MRCDLDTQFFCLLNPFVNMFLRNVHGSLNSSRGGVQQIPKFLSGGMVEEVKPAGAERASM
ncbi:uncharacterized protein N7484_010370 [Penicillium longicatenatum]|uniref:uncharacterized protein n=1 Tax=Penicillium longicatenatum TaxID=1561947 RepID=UPI0025491E29|nr:uncharacterized protein N7484_010370 [Penicillium longicatenatum]KAJ5630270.1 hypothetical protein N7484_010370 [Penicillium longicatenatum]